MVKTCKKCGSIERNKFDQCIPCKRIANAKHRAKTRKEAIERTMKWIKANPEKKKEQTKRYEAKYPEKVNARKRASASKWKRDNPERAKESNAKWYADHPEAKRLKNHNRLARLKANGGKLSRGITKKLFQLQKSRCACCGNKLDKYHLDHRMPVALGGSNTDDNIQLLCPLCNMQKHAKHPVDFMQSKGYLL